MYEHEIGLRSKCLKNPINYNYCVGNQNQAKKYTKSHKLYHIWRFRVENFTKVGNMGRIFIGPFMDLFSHLKDDIIDISA